jgi:hypothetical protein
MDLDERKARLLRAVVHEFIYTEKPVGSKSLTERYSLGVHPRGEEADRLRDPGLLAPRPGLALTEKGMILHGEAVARLA